MGDDVINVSLSASQLRWSTPRKQYKSIIAAVVIANLLLCTRVGSCFSFSSCSQHLTLPRPLNSRAPHMLHAPITKHFLATPQSPPPTIEKEKEKTLNLGQVAVKLYVDYASRLWKETSTEARRRKAKDKARDAVVRMEHLVNGEEYFDIAADDENARNAKSSMISACHMMLSVLNKEEQSFNLNDGVSSVVEPATSIPTVDPKTANGEHKSKSTLVVSTLNNVEKEDKKVTTSAKKPRRSILFGAAMGAVAACWVYSGNFVFTALFTLMTILGQLEYYRMAMNAGIYPARRISICGAAAMFLTALFVPDLHQICLPFFSTVTMIWFLTQRQKVSTIADISTTFTGMSYLGYIPSFWVRIRLIGGGREPTKLAPVMRPILDMLGRKASRLPSFIPKSIHLPITDGANFVFWTWLCIAFSDVGAYFSGRYFGRTKLGELSPAAGATSPNKTVEGVIGGSAVSMFLAVIGAWVQNWPYWYITGPLHGVCVAILGLIGDLTASMLKRDAGLKDFGDLIPEHGGVLDRVDSFVFTAPYSWLVISYILPGLRMFSNARGIS